MKRYEFAPAVVPENAATFLDSRNPYFDQQQFNDFIAFYDQYGQHSPDVDLPVVEACMMTRTLSRSTLILRGSNDEYDQRRYKLFKHDYATGTVTDFAIIKTQFITDSGDFNPERKYSMLYLAESSAGQGVLELGSTGIHPSVWTFQGQEYLLDPIPNLNTRD